jgi:hypothetical protein
MQSSFALGFIGIANDLVNILRVYLINPTYGTVRYHECPSARDEMSRRLHDAESAPTPMAQRHGLRILFSQRPRPPLPKGAFQGEPPQGTPDHPRTRALARGLAGLTGLAFLAATIPGGIGNGQFVAVDDASKSKRLMALRYESCIFFFSSSCMT